MPADDPSSLEREKVDQFRDALSRALGCVGTQFSHAGGKFFVRQPGQKRIGAQGKLVAKLLPPLASVCVTSWCVRDLRPAASNRVMISAVEGRSAFSMGRMPGKNWDCG